MPGIIPVRDGESFDWNAVETYLRRHLNQLPDTSMQVQQFSAGHSNLTYLLTVGDWQGVLRRPPLGPVAPKAHDMRREFHLLQAVHPHVSNAPKPYVLCSDEALIGAPFYVMEKLSGVVLDEEWPYVYTDVDANKRAVSEALIKALADIHRITPKYPEIAQLGHPDGYMRRQVEGWITRHELAMTDDEIPGVMEVGKWLIRNLPDHSRASLIHNDLKLNNVLLHPENPSRIVGIVDWEMSTVGDPLSDLAITLSYWAQPGDPPVLTEKFSNLTAQKGFLRRSDLINLYAKETQQDLDSMAFYMTFAYFKSAGILQQIYYRWWRGQTKDERFAALGEIARDLIQLAIDASKGKYS